ncbi:MAG: AlkZ-related protein [Oscillospiraceae bacterium]
MDFRIDGLETLIEAVNREGILPMFQSGIPGFSVDDMSPEESWDGPAKESPWAWKDAAAGSRRCAYGKLLAGRAGFVSLEWFPKFANYRRDGYDFDSLLDDGLALPGTEEIMNIIMREGPTTSMVLRQKMGLDTRSGRYRFEKLSGWLQMHCYILQGGFVYKKYKNGRTEDYGISLFDTPEHLFGEDLVRSAYSEDPEKSLDDIMAMVTSRHPDFDRKKLRGLLRR